MASTDEQPGDDAPVSEAEPVAGAVEPVDPATSADGPAEPAWVGGDPLLRPAPRSEAPPPEQPGNGDGSSASHLASHPPHELRAPSAPDHAERPADDRATPVPAPAAAPPPDSPPKADPPPPSTSLTPLPVAPAPSTSPWAPGSPSPGGAPSPVPPPAGATGPVRQTAPLPPTAQQSQPSAGRSAPSRRGAAAAKASRSPRVTTQSGPGRRARVRRVTRVLRHVDPWSVFKISAVFCFIAYGIALLSGWLLWRVAYATGTIDNIESGLMSTGWSTFELHGDEIFRNAWVGGLFVTVGMIGLAVLTATLFNLVTDLVGGIRLTVLEEEVVEKAPKVAKSTSAAATRRPATSAPKPQAATRRRRS